MGANLTIYCLENLTDYFEFERLCHDLMALTGFESIEPLGGFSDKGRDAIHIDRSNNTTIFAYSVREDWRAKLAEDASKIHQHGHTCDELVFINTAAFSAGQRDEAVAFVLDEYEWKLELYGLERLRLLLDVTYPQVKQLHPQIFPPEFFPAGLPVEPSIERDHIFISYTAEDSFFAEWLTRKLTAEGYLVWCEYFKSLGEDVFPDDVDAAIKTQVSRVIGVYSRASLRNPEMTRQQTLALSISDGDLVIPVVLNQINFDRLDKVTRSLKFVSFESNWASGLQALVQRLTSVECPKKLPIGKAVAADAFLERDVLAGKTETLLSNCLKIERIPAVVHRFRSNREVGKERIEDLQYEWPCRIIDSKLFLSFHQPPDSFARDYRIELTGGESWRDVVKIENIWSQDLIVELLRKSLVVKAHEKGLVYCPETFLNYFPSGLVNRDRLYFVRPDGSRTFVNAVGKKKYWKPTGSEEYQYYLAPVFSVATNLFDDFMVVVRVRVRLTDTAGVVLPKRKGISRRKHLTKSWWNDEWLNRVLAVCQSLAGDNKIVIGVLTSEQIVIDPMPLSISASEGINEEALDQLSFERSELIAALADSDSDEDTDEGEEAVG